MTPSARGFAAPAALVACLALVSCGGGEAPTPDPVRPPDELSRADGAILLGAGARLREAAKTSRALRNPAIARRLHARVREIISGGALEANELDDFGEAALGELGLAVPSLVETDADGVAESVDRAAVTDFLRYARSDPARALLGPVRRQVEAIEETLERSNAGPRTRIPPRDETASLDLSVSEYLRESGRELRGAWPELAERLDSAREGLDSRSTSAAS